MNTFIVADQITLHGVKMTENVEDKLHSIHSIRSVTNVGEQTLRNEYKITYLSVANFSSVSGEVQV